MNKFTLRDATAHDAQEIAALHTANWRDAYADILDPAYLAGPIETDRRGVWQQRLTTPSPNFEVAVAETISGLVGFTSLFHDREPGWGGLVDNLHSAVAVRGEGVGKALLIDGARRVAARDPSKGLYLWVFERNEGAIGFYRALGAEVAERAGSEWNKAPDEIRYRMHWNHAATLARG